MKTKTAAAAPTAKEVLAQLQKLADPQTKKTMMRHGAVEPIWGVKIGEMKKVQKKTKTNHALALELFDTGIYAAAYFAGMIADAKVVTKKELQHWVEMALAAAKRIGKVECDMGDTACKVPEAPAYIEKIKSMGRLGHKRERVRC